MAYGPRGPSAPGSQHNPLSRPSLWPKVPGHRKGQTLHWDPKPLDPQAWAIVGEGAEGPPSGHLSSFPGGSEQMNLCIQANITPAACSLGKGLRSSSRGLFPDRESQQLPCRRAPRLDPGERPLAARPHRQTPLLSPPERGPTTLTAGADPAAPTLRKAQDTRVPIQIHTDSGLGLGAASRKRTRDNWQWRGVGKVFHCEQPFPWVLETNPLKTQTGRPSFST